MKNLRRYVLSASFSPSWKTTQITRYIAIGDKALISEIAEKYTPNYNSKSILQFPLLIAVHRSKAVRLLEGWVFYDQKQAYRIPDTSYKGGYL